MRAYCVLAIVTWDAGNHGTGIVNLSRPLGNYLQRVTYHRYEYYHENSIGIGKGIRRKKRKKAIEM